MPPCRNRKHQPWRDAGRAQKRYGSVAVQWADTTTEKPPADTAGDRGWSFESRLTGSPRFFPLWLLGFFRCSAPSWRATCRLVRGSRAGCLDTASKRLHKIDNVCRLRDRARDAASRKLVRSRRPGEQPEGRRMDRRGRSLVRALAQNGDFCFDPAGAVHRWMLRESHGSWGAS
jgi:hypothetical protein